MLKVLIVDDTQEKITEVRKVLKGYVKDPDDVPICGCIRESLKACSKVRYDLLILDLFIPYKAGETPSPENAKSFLKLIKNDPDIICPVFVIGITRKQDISDYRTFFEAETLQVLWYAENDDTWKQQLENRLRYLSGVKRNLGCEYEYDYDVAIINALQIPEHEIMMKVVSDSWKEFHLDDDDTTTFFETELHKKDNEKIRVISCYAPQMASVASSALTTKIILRFHPKFLFMTGICAGFKDNRIEIGDIMVATQVWDGMSGKYREIKLDNEHPETIFEPDYRQISIDVSLLDIINRVKSRKEVMQRIKDGFSGIKPNTDLKLHTGPMTSVPAVIASERQLSDLKQHARKLIGLEMESYGVFYAAEHAHNLKPKYTASIKSVSDLGDKNKTDSYQEYASYTSAAFLKYLIENELKF